MEELEASILTELLLSKLLGAVWVFPSFKSIVMQAQRQPCGLLEHFPGHDNDIELSQEDREWCRLSSSKCFLGRGGGQAGTQENKIKSCWAVFFAEHGESFSGMKGG